MKGLGSYIKIFFLAVAIIAVYKTFDSINYLVYAIGSFLHILYPVFVGCAIAFLLYPVCSRLEALYEKCSLKYIHKSRRVLSVLTVMLIALLLVVLAISFVVPAIIKSARELFAQLPSMINFVINFVENLGFEGVTLSSVLNSISIEKLFDKFDFSNVNKYIKGVAGAGSVFFNFLMSVIIAIYILIDRNSLKRGIKRISAITIKKDTLDMVVPYIRLTFGYMYKYFGCLLIDAVVVFVLSLIVFSIIGMKYAPLLALMLGLFNIIPYFGSTIASIIIVLITIITGTISQAVIAAVSIIVLQQIDANIIQPNIVKESLQIKPLWVVVAIIIGGGLFGFVGILVSVPIMAIVLRIINDLIASREKKSTVIE